MKPMPFEFCAPGLDVNPAGAVLRVPEQIQSKGELLAALASVCRFPEYFGGNWDGLLDCLRDFHWIGDKRIVVMHADLPLASRPDECGIYLEILRDAVLDWSRVPDRGASPDSMLPKHELVVTFPGSLRDTVAALLVRRPGPP